MSTHIKASDLKAGDQYRLTEGGDYFTVDSIERPQDCFVVVNIRETGGKRLLMRNDLVQARFVDNVVSL